jgi:hypothetical protein
MSPTRRESYASSWSSFGRERRTSRPPTRERGVRDERPALRPLALALLRLAGDCLENCDGHRLDRGHGDDLSRRDRVRFTHRAARQRDRVLNGRAGALAYEADCLTLALDRLCDYFPVGRGRHSRSRRLSHRKCLDIWPCYRPRGEDTETEEGGDEEDKRDDLVRSIEPALG